MKLGFELRTFETGGHCLPRGRITINLAAHSLKTLIIYKVRKTDRNDGNRMTVNSLIPSYLFFLNMGHPRPLFMLLLQSFLQTQLQQTYCRSIGHIRALLYSILPVK